MRLNTINPSFFNKDACQLAKALIGKILCVYHNPSKLWLYAQIIETEAYYLREKASHASLGFTQKRKALFMPPGTIYMYYARGGDSLNISAKGKGNAVLIKSAYPFLHYESSDAMIAVMQQNNLLKGKIRPINKLCKGQTLLCKSLRLKVPEWDQQQFSYNKFYIGKTDYKPNKIIQTTRLGIPKGRDEHLQYRFIDFDYRIYCTANPLIKKKQ